jgi:hypothetical protein
MDRQENADFNGFKMATKLLNRDLLLESRRISIVAE